jgi:hypothetical protein
VTRCDFVEQIHDLLGSPNIRSIAADIVKKVDVYPVIIIFVTTGTTYSSTFPVCSHLDKSVPSCPAMDAESSGNKTVSKCDRIPK